MIGAIYQKIFFTLGSIVLTLSFSQAQTLAFPGAEGYGRFVSGGRGGEVLFVTNLEDDGPGSLRAAIEAVGPRTVIFKVSGTIRLKSPLEISNNDITIAGQSAPGDGICLRDYPLWIAANNVIIRYIRSRLGDIHRLPEDAISSIYRKDIIIDHCSFSWGIDEVASFWDNENSTVQWCIISESLNHSYHPKGDHGYGGIWGGMKATFHHNLLAHHSSRNPRLNGSRYHKQPELELVDFRNNVIYNWGFNSTYGGESGQQNLVNNYYKSGPGSRHQERIAEPWDAEGKWYVDGNFVQGYPDISTDNWSGGVQGKYKDLVRIFDPNPFEITLTHSANQAYEVVLRDAGACLPVRDLVDERIIQEVKTGSTHYGGEWGENSGIIDSQEEVGGWPDLASTVPPADDDSDGMPDEWEIDYGLNPLDPADRNGDLNEDGYTNLEEYLNSLTFRMDFLNAPGELNAKIDSPGGIVLSWKENTLNEEGFSIERKEIQMNDFDIIGHTGPNITTFSDYDLSPEAKYEYKVRAFRGKLSSTPSNSVIISTAESDIYSP
ncbi:MAG: pectate lyase [bacterium]|nr:MAG: pectate lyase [bacterium]